MSRCRTLSIVALTGCLFLTSVAQLHAQSDAEIALQNARAAFQAEQFERARDLSRTASQTDAKNPDVWLLLGKAHLQLGELDQALTAWRTLLRLAPGHEYARRMVTALEGRITDVDTRIKLAEVMISEGLTSQSQVALQTLRGQTSLSESQRQKVLMLLAEIEILHDEGTAALATINELTTRSPEIAKTLPVRLLTARIQLAIGGELTAFGLKGLSEIGEGDTPEAPFARLELLLYRISRGEDAVADLATWIEENAALSAAGRARQALRDSMYRFLAASVAQPTPKQDAVLNDHDKSALAVAAHAFQVFVDVKDQIKLASALTAHIENRFVGTHAYTAARSGLALIDQIQLPAAVREVVSASRARIDEAEATYEYGQISRDVSATAASPDVLRQWIADHVGHPKELEARQNLVFAYLNATQQQAAPRPDAELTESDQSAIAAAGELIPKLKTPADVSKIVEALAQHFHKHYFLRNAHAAAIAGMKAVLPLENATRRGLLMQMLLQMQTDVALTELWDAVMAGTVPSGTAPMPASLQTAAATTARTRTDFPARVTWAADADLARRVLETASSVPWPTRVTGPKAAHGWALSLAIPVIRANAAPETVKIARAVIDGVINELAAVKQPSAAGLATSSHEQLLLLLAPEHPLWAEVLLRHVDLLVADASRSFDDNVRSGEGAKNSRLTETQERILKLLSDVVKQRPAFAGTALTKLEMHLRQWSTARHDVVVEAAYQTFSADLPPATQRQAHLALARLWFRQVLRAHSLTLANGFQVPQVLDPQSEKALEQCYRLAGSVGVDDPLLADINGLRLEIVNHYLALDYEDVAEAAIRVKVDPANADLDESAELQLAGLQRRVAERQLARQLKQHGGKKQIVLTPAFHEAIAALKTFITDHPTSERVPTAAEGVFIIGKHFEQQEAWLIAAQVYEDFEQFAGEIESLNQIHGDKLTYSERAATERATALHTRASLALQAWNVAKQADTPPPVALSDEFQAAQAAWQRVIADYQQRPVAKTAIARIAAIAQEYAAVNAWDVADATYAALLGLELPLRAPERLEFGRAICQLGKVLPDHARAVMAALAGTGTNASEAGGDDSGLMGDVQVSGLAELELQIVAPVNEPAAATAAAAEVADTRVSATPGTIDKLADLNEAAGFGSRGIGGGGFAYEQAFRQKADAQLMAAVRTQLDRQAQQVALLRDEAIAYRTPRGDSDQSKEEAKVPVPGQPADANKAVLSDAELQRQQQALDAVYTALQTLRSKYADSSTAEQARDEIFVIVNHWRAIAQWNRAAQLARKFLTDNPTDIKLPTIRQEIARDWLAWASTGVHDRELDREELLSEITGRFETARDELRAIIVAFPDETALRHQAQWDIANSFLTQARVVIASSPTLARGQYVRAATELLRVAELYHDHPQIGTIPDMLWAIGMELNTRGYHDEAITVWSEAQIHYPAHDLADQAALRIAQTWQQIGQPLRAVETYLELNYARGGNDTELQNAIYKIAAGLRNEKRWIESLHVLQTFVDSFPSHADAGQALTAIGQIHQANEVWEDAIASYRRVIDEFPTGAWTTEARWSIAECTINLSLWQEAIGAYAEFQTSYPEDARVAEAASRIEILKTLDRYQNVVDEEGQRKAFDAQFQVATIVYTQLANPVKAIIEYRKVTKNWPDSHLADDALFEIGEIYLQLSETELARTALLQAADRYPDSPLADDALLLVGTSYVREADQLTTVDRDKSQALAKDIAQKRAYHFAQDNRRRQFERNNDEVTALKAQGKSDEAANKEAYFAGQALQFDVANTLNASIFACAQEEILSAAQLADRHDKINAALRRAVDSFRSAASVNAADKADDALLQMAQIYDERLKDSVAAMSTWKEIVKQYSGTAVAEDASWKNRFLV